MVIVFSNPFLPRYSYGHSETGKMLYVHFYWKAYALHRKLQQKYLRKYACIICILFYQVCQHRFCSWHWQAKSCFITKPAIIPVISSAESSHYCMTITWRNPKNLIISLRYQRAWQNISWKSTPRRSSKCFCHVVWNIHSM